LIPVPGAYSNLRNVTIRHCLVHWIRRRVEAGVYEANDLAAVVSD